MRTTRDQDTKFLAEVISTALLEDAMQWIGVNMTPAEVFPEEDLQTWAEANGYVQEE